MRILARPLKDSGFSGVKIEVFRVFIQGGFQQTLCSRGCSTNTFVLTGALLNFQSTKYLQSFALKEVPSRLIWDFALRKFRGVPANTVVFRR